MNKINDTDKHIWQEFSKYIKKNEPCNLDTSGKPIEKRTTSYKTRPLEIIKPQPNHKVQLLSINEIKNFTIQDTLDLHGYRVDSAYQAFDTFIKRCYYNKLRMVLIITGKGKHGNYPGILQSMVLKWIPAYPQYIIGYLHALPKHGGSGALYIRLRKNP